MYSIYPELGEIQVYRIQRIGTSFFVFRLYPRQNKKSSTNLNYFFTPSGRIHLLQNHHIQEQCHSISISYVPVVDIVPSGAMIT